MEKYIFNNTHVLAWLKYFAENTDVDLEHIKILDITRKNKNLIPACEAHRCVLVFTEAGHPDIFYRMFDAGLGECTVVYNEGSDPVGPIKHSKVYDMINRGINASAGMLILNPNARSTIKFGMDNQSFATGSVRYVGSEIRAVLLSKLMLNERSNICVISGASIAVEAGIVAGEGSIVAVEYSSRDRRTIEENAAKFGLNNISIIDRVDDSTMQGLPVPDAVMVVASADMEQELACLLRLNPQLRIVIYTLDFITAAAMPAYFESLGLPEPDVAQITVAKLNSKHCFDTQPAPWIISGGLEG